jgi:hypothetical protein
MAAEIIPLLQCVRISSCLTLAGNSPGGSRSKPECSWQAGVSSRCLDMDGQYSARASIGIHTWTESWTEPNLAPGVVLLPQIVGEPSYL